MIEVLFVIVLGIIAIWIIVLIETLVSFKNKIYNLESSQKAWAEFTEIEIDAIRSTLNALLSRIEKIELWKEKEVEEND